MRQGEQIGVKFNADGTPRMYPGNTVISDVRAGNPAHALMLAVRQSLIDAGLAALFILLPEGSYHMTVIRGLNDLVREDAYWPAALGKDASLMEMDAYVSRAVASVKNPGPIAMAFDHVRVDGADVRVCLRPLGAAQDAVLRRYRDRVADALGLRLPGHDGYTYHLTLAYTLRLPEGGEAARLARWTAEADAMLAKAPAFETTPPYMAYYHNMEAFSPVRR